MPSKLSDKQIAFDAAVQAKRDFMYPGIADLDALRGQYSPEFIDQLVTFRDGFNAALAVEGQHIVGDAPHAPVYLDYLDSIQAQGLAFKDANHSFIGITVLMVLDVLLTARQIADHDAVVALMGLPHVTDRDALHAVLAWMLLGFVVGHELSHHTHGHLLPPTDNRIVFGRLRRQAHEADADGWAAYMTLNQWALADGRKPLIELLHLTDASAAIQDNVIFAAFVVAQAAFTFVREPEPIDKDKVYWSTHPPQPVRLHLMSRYVLKFCGEFKHNVRQTLTQPRYQALMDAVSRLMWTNGRHAALWREHHAFMCTADGAAYLDALIAELDSFRVTLRRWHSDAEAKIQSSAQ
jgi:hypothetical protein